jgi:hypothetical protein
VHLNQSSINEHFIASKEETTLKELAALIFSKLLQLKA